MHDMTGRTHHRAELRDGRAAVVGAEEGDPRAHLYHEHIHV